MSPELLVQGLCAALVLLGAAVALVGAWGIWALPAFAQRLHAPTVIGTLGLGAITLAALLYPGSQGLHAGLLLLAAMLTAPVSAQWLAQAARDR